MEVIEVPVEWINFLEENPMSEDTLRYVIGVFNVNNDDTVTLVRDLIAPEAAPVQAEVISLGEPEEEYGYIPNKPGKTEVTETPVIDPGETKEIK